MLVLAFASGCTFDDDVTPHAHLLCASGADCPSALVCVRASSSDAEGVCGSPGACVVVSKDRDATTQPDGNACGSAHTGTICVAGACIKARCGDGVVTASLHETCDGDDGCRDGCTRCGDGVVDAAAGEACDNGAENSDTTPGACRTSCLLAACGDGVHDPGEECDDGAGNSDTDADACRTSCTRARCGDGVVDVGEACDDGNVVGGDGCSSDCSKVEVCGDGFVDVGEDCDDGNANPYDGCDGCRTQTWTSALLVSGRIDGTALEVGLNAPEGVAVDALGRVIVADTDNNRVRRVELDGTMTTIAGSPDIGDGVHIGDGGPATSAHLNGPFAVDVDASGNVFVADSQNHRIRKIDADGIITTVAGNGTSGFAGDGGLATLAELSEPTDVVLDAGRLFIADRDNNRVRVVDRDGTIHTIAGTGVLGAGGDGGVATNAQLRLPLAVAVDPAGVVYIADSENFRVRKIDENGIITTFAGSGFLDFSGDGGLAINAGISQTSGVAVDALGGVLISGINSNRIRRVAPDGTISTFAGTGVFGSDGDGGAATAARFGTGAGVRVDASGRVFLVDETNARVRRVDVDGTIHTIAGAGDAGYAGDGGPLTSVAFAFASPVSVAVDDASGRVLVVDTGHDSIRAIENGTIDTIAGGVGPGFSGDGGAAISAALNAPVAIVPDGQGGFLVAEENSNRVRRIDAAGIITTVAGDGAFGFAGDGGPATSANLAGPSGVVADALGRVVIADTRNARVRRVELDGTINTIAGSGAFVISGDGGLATAAGVNEPGALAIDAQGRLLIVEQAGFVRRVDVDGTIHTIAGAAAGSSADGVLATAAKLLRPVDVVVDAQGRLLIADQDDARVRRIELDGTITTVAGTIHGLSSGDGGLATQAIVETPAGLAFDSAGRLFIADPFAQSVRVVDVDGTISTVAGAIDPLGPGSLTRAQLYSPVAVALAAGSLFTVGAAGRLVDVDLAAAEVEVVAGYDRAAPAVQGLARFASPLAGAAGVAFDPASSTVVVVEAGANALRLIALDPDGDGVIDAPSSWTSARVPLFLDDAAGIARDPSAGNFVVADRGAHCIERIDLAGNILDVVAGECEAPGVFPGHLSAPSAVAVTAAGVVYVSDTGNNRVLRVDVDGTTALVIGDGSASSAGEGAPARLFPVRAPAQLAVDAFGNLYVASTTTVREIENVDGDADADGDDRVITIYGGGDRATFPESASLCMSALTVDPAGVVYAADACQGFLVALTPVRAP